MDLNKITYSVKSPEMFDLGLSLDCGQAFRWEKDENNIFSGVAFGKIMRAKQENGRIDFYGPDEKDFNNVFRKYLDFDRDYKNITDKYKSDPYLSAAVNEYGGIRILRQDPWEALCSFIISQNNNIPRIKGIIKRLCENFGKKIENDFYSFPEAAVLSEKTVEDLAPLRSGFRAKYILDAAKKVSSGEISFDAIDKNPIDFGREELQKIKGVGKKVAECTLLYGFGKIEAFPVDVWVKKIMTEMYPDGLPKCTENTEGIAQQYLFHWRRNSRNVNEIIKNL